MKKSIVLSWIIFSFLTTKSQQYKVRTDKTDKFSSSLISLLNCAVTDFNSCKGLHLQYTMMQENEYQLNIEFPGATAAIVRERDNWDKSAYIEFRGYPDLNSLQKGMNVLTQKIKHALGDKLNPDHKLHSGPDNSWFLTGLSIQDENGYFSSNIELMSGSSGSPSYLLEKEGDRSDDTANRKYFILLKVQRGIPLYYYYIRRDIPQPDNILNDIVAELAEAARTDFIRFKKKEEDLLRRRYTDTILINGQMVYLRYGGQHFQATLMFPSSSDKNVFSEKWKYYHQVVQAALGNNYVYHLSSYDGKPSIVYFRKDHVADHARVYLQAGENTDLSPVIFIRIESSISHPVKRNATLHE